MDDLELVFKASQEELWAEEGKSGKRLELPLSFWRALSEGLRAAGYPQFAAAIDQAVSAAQARERLLSEKMRCMEPLYDQEAQARCQAILAEDLRPEDRA
ncbi:hypothetical protein H5T56_06520 [Candidatus Bipolaricaulota bacterium]|nr:hypothetical protein [Candidatus Bipolaricaulota bacterium]